MNFKEFLIKGLLYSTLILNMSNSTFATDTKVSIIERDESKQEVRYERKYNTCIHRFLDLENEEFNNACVDTYMLLDAIINEVKERIGEDLEYCRVYSIENKIKALNVLREINKVLRDYKFKNLHYDKPLVRDAFSLENNRDVYFGDCDIYTFIYLAMGEVLNLPLVAVEAPHHVFVRWYFDRDHFFNWETLDGIEKSDNEYRLEYKISEDSISRGIYLRGLNSDELLAMEYFNIGLGYYYKNEFEQALVFYNKAVELHPRFYEVYREIDQLLMTDGNVKGLGKDKK